eukprot:scaffold1788_cov396-Prasinococcus_capsulatus_cf.AAC.2
MPSSSLPTRSGLTLLPVGRSAQWRCYYLARSEPRLRSQPARDRRHTRNRSASQSERSAGHVEGHRGRSSAAAAASALGLPAKGIDGEIPSKRVLFGRAEAHLRDARILGVALRAQVHEVDFYGPHAHCGSLQVLALLWVGGDDAHAPRFTAQQLQVLVHLLRQLTPQHIIHGDVDVMRLLPEQLVAHPASCRCRPTITQARK